MGVDLARYEDEVWQFFNHRDWHVVDCTVCRKNRDSYLIFTKGHMNVVRCECGAVYAQTQPVPHVLKEFYDKSYALEIWADFKKEDFARQTNKFNSVKDFLTTLQPTSLLDLGAGNGKFLKCVESWLPGTRLKGIDPSPFAVKAAQEVNAPVASGTFEDFDKVNDEKFDVISLWGVMEHLSNPHEVVEKLKGKLTTNGHVIVCVPNVDSTVVKTLWKKCFTFCPQHLWYFNIESLSRLMRQYQFKLVHESFIESEALPILKYTFGFNPYDDLPKWAENKYVLSETLEDLDTIIKQTGGTYKIVCVYQAQ